MEIVVLSGKGGTGKTTVATNLAQVLNMNYIDCDVEEPNGHIFLKPTIEKQIDVEILNPVIDKDKCTLCGKCAEACQFNALATVPTGVMLFKELCHGCGACMIACLQGAITEVGRSIGIVSVGNTDGISFMSGKLNIKEPMGGPIISKLKEISKFDDHKLLDSSPGTSCSVVKTLDGADYALLVTEPTKFGLHDLKLAVALVKEMGISHGIIVNRNIEGNSMIQDYCESENIDLIGEIPFSRKAAELYSQGLLLIDNPEYKMIFETIGTKLIKEASRRSSDAISGN
ncbi:MAG: (4Fe-4S)-binding protein [Alkaliphilus sp.]|nr:ATP-binding protein [bacterium AH-315-L21]PHS33844.1 MAG: (4Fe-4S)-binding protein [Alkaliphilus sp.]